MASGLGLPTVATITHCAKQGLKIQHGTRKGEKNVIHEPTVELSDKDGTILLTVTSACVVVTGIVAWRRPWPRFPVWAEVVPRRAIQISERDAEAAVHIATVVVAVIAARRPTAVSDNEEVSAVVVVRVPLSVAEPVSFADALHVGACVRRRSRPARPTAVKGENKTQWEHSFWN